MQQVYTTRGNKQLLKKRIGETAFKAGFEQLKQIQEGQGQAVETSAQIENTENFLLKIYENGSGYFSFPKAKMLVCWKDSQFNFSFKELGKTKKPALTPPPKGLVEETNEYTTLGL